MQKNSYIRYKDENWGWSFFNSRKQKYDLTEFIILLSVITLIIILSM